MSEQECSLNKMRDVGVSLATGESHKLIIQLPDLIVRLDIDPKASESQDDQFTLKASGPSGIQDCVKTVKDDQIKGDQYVDLIYPKLRPGHRYTMIVDPGDGGEPYALFENKPFEDLFDL